MRATIGWAAVVAGIGFAGPAGATSYTAEVDAFAGFDANGQYVGTTAAVTNGNYNAPPSIGSGGGASFSFGSYSAKGSAYEVYDANVASASSAVDIASGSLHDQATGSTAYGNASANSTYKEGLLFNNTTGRYQNLSVQFTVDGAISGNTLSNSRVTATAAISASSTVYFSYAAANGQNGVYVDDVGNTDPSTYSVRDNGFFNRVYTANISLAPGLDAGYVSASLSAGCGAVTDCNYGNTTFVTFGPLPAGVSYTSDSGVFLTAPPDPVTTPPPVTNPVPEPASVAMLGVAFAGLAARRLRFG